MSESLADPPEETRGTRRGPRALLRCLVTHADLAFGVFLVGLTVRFVLVVHEFRHGLWTIPGRKEPRRTFAADRDRLYVVRGSTARLTVSSPTDRAVDWDNIGFRVRRGATYTVQAEAPLSEPLPQLRATRFKNAYVVAELSRTPAWCSGVVAAIVFSIGGFCRWAVWRDQAPRRSGSDGR